jgi:hypothetical protein
MNGSRITQVFKVTVMVFVIMGLASCAKQIVKFDGDSNTIKQWKKIALVELLIGPPDAPIFPLIDAGIYRGSFHKIAPQLQEVHKEKIGILTDQVGAAIKNASGAECLFGKELISNTGYTDSSITGFPVTLQNEFYNEIVVMPGTKNFCEMGTQKIIDNFLDKNKPSPESMTKLAKNLQVDGMVIGIVSVPTLNVGMFGINGTRMVKISLYFFDAQGKFFVKGYASTKPGTSGPGNIEHYSMTLEQCGPLAADLANAIFQKPKQ